MVSWTGLRHLCGSRSSSRRISFAYVSNAFRPRGDGGRLIVVGIVAGAIYVEVTFFCQFSAP